MTTLKKNRIKAAFKYTWPFYIVFAVVTTFALWFVFGITHKTPAYKTLTLFVSGEVKDSKKLKNDMLEKYKDNELKSFSCIYADPSDGNYYHKLSVPGYNSADVLIIPQSRLDNLNASAFALDFDENLINTYYTGLSLFTQNDVNYGVKLDKEKVKQYMALPTEDCYMLLNAKSQNIGEYSSKPVKEHDTALKVLKDWGM